LLAVVSGGVTVNFMMLPGGNYKRSIRENQTKQIPTKSIPKKLFYHKKTVLKKVL
jgi:hypothetical protein